ncbi:hypothetical protein JIQ42_01926 [Leishmania sp. Namibia]|uniref:hypothetical protein n=1 Tax=Leishmania sp. Namibia TaxID=2802991 RepID=UPI001B6C19EC|nr:hypothetical protein JIQ42_01926 [Leishmania sp. Namibia]
MSGIIHKESLPAQSLIKRRRVDTQATTELCKEGKCGDDNEKRVDNVETSGAGENGAIRCTEAQSGSFGSAFNSLAKTENASISSSSSSSDSSSDDDDDQIERENARLAKLREQRSRRQQEQHKTSKYAASSSTQSSANVPGSVDGTSPPSALQAQEGALQVNSYDHDVLFRRAVWRHPSKAATDEEKRKQKWDSVLNRTQDSAAFRHFMKNYFK